MIQKPSIVFHALDLLYYILVEMASTNEIITAIISEFMTKTIDNKNKHLWHHILYLIDQLKLLQFLYLTKHNLMSIMSIMRSLKQVYTMGK